MQQAASTQLVVPSFPHLFELFGLALTLEYDAVVDQLLVQRWPPLEALSPAQVCDAVADQLVFCRDGPSQLVTLPQESIWQLDASCVDIPWVLHQLAHQLQADHIRPLQNCQGMFCTSHRPALPSGWHHHMQRPGICGDVIGTDCHQDSLSSSCTVLWSTLPVVLPHSAVLHSADELCTCNYIDLGT